MADKKVDDSQTSSLELLDSVPESLVRRIKQYSGHLATEAVHVMGERLSFFADLEASQRASVQLVVQTALVNFAEWMRNPRGDVGYTAEAFALVPQELTRRIALRQTVDMVRVTMEHFEEAVARAVERIRRGEFEKIILAREVAVRAGTDHDAAAVFDVLRGNFGSCFVFCAVREDAAFVAASPELLIRRQGSRAQTVALAGSTRRSADPAVDDHLGEQLRVSTNYSGTGAPSAAARCASAPFDEPITIAGYRRCG